MEHWALLLAGSVGTVTAIVHGVLTGRILIRPIDLAFAERSSTPASVRRIVPPLLQYSTYSWLTGGIALIVAAFVCDAGPRMAIGLLVGSMYAYAALANGWATRWRHPGWMLMAVAVALIVFDLLR